MIIEIPLKKEIKVLVKEKDKIKIGQPLWEYKQAENIEINVADQLKIKPNNIFDYLKKFINDEVKENDIIAEKKTFFNNKRILAPTDGFIKEINHDLGIITLSKVIKKSLFLSFFKGEIEKINEKGIKIKISNGKEYPIKKSTFDGDFFGGEVTYITNEHFSALDVENKIVVAKKLNPLEQIKAEALGAKGLIILNEKEEESDIPIFIVKNLNDFNEIEEEKKTACIVLKNNNKIIFYD